MKKFKIFFLVFLAGILSSMLVHASHYRFGSISWSVKEQTATSTKVLFTITQAWALGSLGPGPTPGTVSPGFPFYFGDGNSVPIIITVTETNANDGWFYGSFIYEHEYQNTSQSFTAFYSSGNRIFSCVPPNNLQCLQNNGNESFYNETIVNLGKVNGSLNNSPVSTIFPIITMPVGQQSATFDISAIDPDGDNLTFEMATPAEMGTSSNLSGMTVNQTSGKLSFNTENATIGNLYNGAVTIRDGRSKITIDFILQIVENGAKPEFVYGTSKTPDNFQTFEILVGQPLTFNVIAKDINATEIVRLNSVGLPPNSSMSSPVGTNPVNSIFSFNPTTEGFYIIVFGARNSKNIWVYTRVSITVIRPPVNCKDCIPSFSPVPAKEYIISGWVKEPGLLLAGQIAYTSGLEIEYEGVPDNLKVKTFTPTGAVIDGWQRIEGRFLIPATATSITVRLKNNSATDAFFDDIRVHPLNAGMKSFVYDPGTRQLTAELDDNNYATFYDYDEEGALVRVRKETERGVKTIRETRSRQIKSVPLTTIE